MLSSCLSPKLIRKILDWILFAEDLKSSYLADNSLKYNKLQKHIPFHSVLLHKHPIMKKEITRLICAAICCTPIIGFAQTSDKFTSTDNLYKEGKELFPGKKLCSRPASTESICKTKACHQPSSRRRIHAGQFRL